MTKLKASEIEKEIFEQICLKDHSMFRKFFAEVKSSKGDKLIDVKLLMNSDIKIAKKILTNADYCSDDFGKFLNKLVFEINEFSKIENCLFNCNGKKEKKYCWKSAYDVLSDKILVEKKVKKLPISDKLKNGTIVEIKSNNDDFSRAYKYSANINLATFKYKNGNLLIERIEIVDQDKKSKIEISDDAKKELAEKLLKKELTI